MGLSVSHGAWSGGYGYFNSWRKHLAELAGLPPLELMEGFFVKDQKWHCPATLYYGPMDDLWERKRCDLENRLPIKWESLKPNPLHKLLYHSDCDGHIPWSSCRRIADELEKLLPLHQESDFKVKTEIFITGLRAAYAAKQRLRFH